MFGRFQYYHCGDDGNIKEALYESAKTRTTGFGLDEGMEMGPVITAESRYKSRTVLLKKV